nr:putative nicotinamide mononucleotide adenylyltransferase [Quercus suber]
MTDTSDNEMTSRLAIFRPLVARFKDALHTFQTCESQKFQILATIHPSNPNNPQSPESPSLNESAQTLFILDSSFNPPSLAHRTLAQSALHYSSTSKHEGPYRLLLLFATMNADKNPSPAAFEQRITLMTMFASDLMLHLQRLSETNDHEIVPIDIGITKAPYYTDKTLAITAEAKQFYPDEPKHVHLIGFDTLVRFFDPKYYSSFNPPLSALAPYFDTGHHIRATLRPDDGFGSLQDQQAYVLKLGNGELESVGGNPQWAKQVDVVRAENGFGVSSTKIRNAATDNKWDDVRNLCTPRVAEWLQTEKLYND